MSSELLLILDELALPVYCRATKKDEPCQRIETNSNFSCSSKTALGAIHFVLCTFYIFSFSLYLLQCLVLFYSFVIEDFPENHST